VAQLLNLPLTPTTSAPQHARRAISDLLARTGRADLAADAALLVTELVTNAVVHTGGPVVVTAAYHKNTLRVEVHDSEPALPVIRQRSTLRQSGRGLRLVAHLAHRWAIAPQPDGKTIWFELT
jgi:anti-sigma regulatory factor (Ser/Thr protein kinase)